MYNTSVIWKNVVGYDGYYKVSNFGFVKSISRHIPLIAGGTRYVNERILKPKTTADGYRFVALSKNGKSETAYIHRLVAEAFIPNLKELPEVNHKDGCKANNNVDNLEWVTHQENVVHAYQQGLYRFKRVKSNNFPMVI